MSRRGLNRVVVEPGSSNGQMQIVGWHPIARLCLS